MPQHALGDTQRGAGHSHTGEWWPWSLSLPLGTGSVLVLVMATWHAPCPPMPALLLVVLLLLSLSLPLPAVLPCCMQGQGTNSPQPFASQGPVFQLLGLIHLAGAAMSYSELALL